MCPETTAALLGHSEDERCSFLSETEEERKSASEAVLTWGYWSTSPDEQTLSFAYFVCMSEVVHFFAYCLTALQFGKELKGVASSGCLLSSQIKTL